MSISNQQREIIRQLAGECCEYCRIVEDVRFSKFQIDHIIPVKHGGSNDTENLCLACLKCNSYKGPNVAALDPSTGEATKLYNPRTQRWNDHLRLNSDATIIGLSPEGRATVVVLRMNDRPRVQHRQIEIILRNYPCRKKE